jgi:hypothetical protein
MIGSTISLEHLSTDRDPQDITGPFTSIASIERVLIVGTMLGIPESVIKDDRKDERQEKR